MDELEKKYYSLPYSDKTEVQNIIRRLSKVYEQQLSKSSNLDDEVADLPMTMDDGDTKDSSKNGA